MRKIRSGENVFRGALRRMRSQRDETEAALLAYSEAGEPRVFAMGTQDRDLPDSNTASIARRDRQAGAACAPWTASGPLETQPSFLYRERRGAADESSWPTGSPVRTTR